MRCIYLIYKLSKLLYPKYSDKNRLGTRNLIFSNFTDYFKIFSESCQTFVTTKRKRTLIYEENCILGHDDTGCCQPAEL